MHTDHSSLPSIQRRSAVRPLLAAVAAALCSAVALAQAPASPAAPAAPATQAAAPAAPASPIAPGLVAPAAPAKGSVDKLPWLVGCWQGKIARDGSVINEAWFSPRGGTIMGVGQTYRDGKTTAWEAMRMYDEGDSVKLWLRPGARGEVTFSLEAAAENFAEFAVTEGATTTKLRYERKSDSEIMATLRFIQGENRRGADFVFSRVECGEFFAAAKPEAAAK